MTNVPVFDTGIVAVACRLRLGRLDDSWFEIGGSRALGHTFPEFVPSVLNDLPNNGFDFFAGHSELNPIIGMNFEQSDVVPLQLFGLVVVVVGVKMLGAMCVE